MSPLASALLSGSSIDLDATFFVSLALFFGVFFMLRAMVFKPMLALFDAREQAIDGAKADADRLMKEAGTAGQHFEEELRKVRLQAQKERDAMRSDALRREREILDAVRVETEKSVADADAKLASDAETLRRDLRARVPGLAKEMASKLLQREVV